jgi:hypothetical protein
MALELELDVIGATEEVLLAVGITEEVEVDLDDSEIARIASPCYYYDYNNN